MNTNIIIHNVQSLKNKLNDEYIIFVVWKKVGINGEYSKCFIKNQNTFDSELQMYVYQKIKEEYPELFL